MKSLGIRGVVLLVVVFASVLPVFASPPTGASGYAEVLEWGVDENGYTVAEVSYTGTLQGTLMHTITEGRADQGTFEGCVAGRCGTADMLIVRTKRDQSVQGFQGKWVILGGSGELENLRGQGTFVLTSFDPVGGPYEGQIHFEGH